MDFNHVAHPWHVAFDKRSQADQLQFQRAFARLAKQQLGLGPDDVRKSALHMTISFDSLPTMLGIMNIAVTLDDLVDIAPRFASPTAPAADNGGPSDTSSPPIEDHTAPQYDSRFDWSGLVALHDSLVPLQNETIAKLLGAISLLDDDGDGIVKLSVLREALCGSGLVPLSDAEFQHLLYRHHLLHRGSLTVFEVVRLLLGVPVQPIHEALQSAAR